MDPLLDFFTRHVISAYTTGDRTRTGPKPNKTTPNTTDDDYEENDFHFGITDNLLNLISRIATLHALPRPESGLTPATTISAALAIWHDLQNWRPPTMIPSREFDAIYGAYSSALFIWLYLLIHPDNVTDEKVQKMVREGMGDLDAVRGEGMGYLLIPLFIHGLAAVEEGDRGVVEEGFKRVERVAGLAEVRRYRDVVRASWKAYARGFKRSWDVGYGAG